MLHTPVSNESSAPSWSAPVAPPADPPRPGLAARGALALLRAYKYLLSPWFTGACRFVPTCGDYAAEAIARHGIIYGTWLGAKRLARCQPFASHGHDPVPTGAHRSTGPAAGEPNGEPPTGERIEPVPPPGGRSHPNGVGVLSRPRPN